MIVTMYMKLNDENSHLMTTEHECYVIQTKKVKLITGKTRNKNY